MNSKQFVLNHLKITCSNRRIRQDGHFTDGFQINELTPSQGMKETIHTQSQFIGYLNINLVTLKQFSEMTKNLTANTSPMRRLEWYDKAENALSEYDTEFDLHNKAHLQNLESLLEKFDSKLSQFSYGVRDLAYFDHRYFKNPLKLYSIRLILDAATDNPIAVVFLCNLQQKLHIIDYIGSFSDFDNVINCLKKKLNNTNSKSLRLLLPENVIQTFNMLAPANYATPFHAIHFSNTEDKTDIGTQNIYFTAGDSVAF